MLVQVDAADVTYFSGRPHKRVLHVTLPVIVPGITCSHVLGFVISSPNLGELSSAFLLFELCLFGPGLPRWLGGIPAHCALPPQSRRHLPCRPGRSTRLVCALGKDQTAPWAPLPRCVCVYVGLGLRARKAPCRPVRASLGHLRRALRAVGVCLTGPALLAVGFSILSGTTQVPLRPHPPGVWPPDVGRGYSSTAAPTHPRPLLESMTALGLWPLWVQTRQPEPGKESVLPALGPLLSRCAPPIWPPCGVLPALCDMARRWLLYGAVNPAPVPALHTARVGSVTGILMD